MFLAMKLSCVFTLLATFALSANTSVMSQRVNLEFRNADLREVFRSLKEQTGHMIIFSEDELRDATHRVTINRQGVELHDALEEVLRNSPYTFSMRDQMVAIIPVAAVAQTPTQATQQAPTENITVRGVVRGADGRPMAGVVAREKGSFRGITTDANGTFALPVSRQINSEVTLVFSFLGFQTHEVVVGTNAPLNVVMTADVVEVGTVVVTGIFNKPADSFTGSYTHIPRQDLLDNKSRNLIQTLAIFEPSLRIVTNNRQGSNPNHLPELELRGATSFMDLDALRGTTPFYANTPLIIYDGFEITLERFMDLNIEDVESITILKDASATSLYGSRGANGVIVITPLIPVSGELRINYTGTLRIEIPDLNSYNILNARQKLEVEAAAGLYRDNPALYLRLFEAIESGVDTDWMRMVTRTGYGQYHALNIGGGDRSFRFNFSVSHDDHQGVMRGSSRKNTSGNLSVNFEKNRFYITTSLMGNLMNQHESPFGSFHEIANLNPYWTLFNDAGEYNMTFFHPSASGIIYNNVYNGHTSMFDKRATTTMISNTRLRYSLFENTFHIEGQLSAGRTTGSSDMFRPRSHTLFMNEPDLEKKGRYRKRNTVSNNWETSLSLRYGKIFAERHSLNANFRTGLLGRQFDETGATGTGFLNDGVNHFSDALVFQQSNDLHLIGPEGRETVSRQVNFIGSLDYYYDQRYSAEVNISYNGGSSFGAASRWQHYYSLGARWNVHNEHFFDVPFINRLTARYSYGVSGNESFASPHDIMYVYEYINDLNSMYRGHQGAFLTNYGNPHIGWQEVYMHNAEINLELFRKIQLTGAYYRSHTMRGQMRFGLTPSHGYELYLGNIGEMINRGWELRASVMALNTRDWRINVSANFAHNKNIVHKLSDEMTRYLQNQTGLGSGLTSELYYQLREGQSMRALWVLESLGVDPMTGRRIYMNANGVPQIWSSNFGEHPRVYVGNADPKVNGSTTLSLWWRGVSLNTTFAYRWGGYALNSTVLYKVEEIQTSGWANNLDRRIYTDRWRKPGDVMKYKGINTGLISGEPQGVYTFPNTSFIQRDNMLSIVAMNLAWDLPREWVRKNLGLQSLSLVAQMSDIYYTSTVWRERGTEYPFSFNPNFTIRASF